MAETSIVPVDDECREITVVSATNVIEQQTRGEIDVQIATAKKYPRSIRTFLDTVRAMVTLNTEVAESGMYALPRGGKTIEGPTSRFAEMVASAWGHLRAGSAVTDVGETFITVRGFAWDVQANVAVHFEVRRRITDRSGKRYNEDMIGVTAAAAGSIAYRNAVLKVVPAAFWKQLYLEARRVAVGDAKTLVDRRAAALAELAKMGVREDRVFGVLQVKGVEDIGLEELARLRAMFVSIRDEGADVDSMFPLPGSAVGSASDASKPVTAALVDRLEAARADRGVDAKPAEQAPEPVAAKNTPDGFGAEMGSLMDTPPATEPAKDEAKRTYRRTTR